MRHFYVSGPRALNHEYALTIDLEYNKSLDRRRPCLEDELNGGSNNVVQSNKSV